MARTGEFVRVIGRHRCSGAEEDLVPLSEARDGLKHGGGNGTENGKDGDAMDPVKDGGVLVE